MPTYAVSAEARLGAEIRDLKRRLAALENPSFPTDRGFRNVIRNGDMGVAQRGDGPFGPNSGTYSVDGWRIENSTNTGVQVNRLLVQTAQDVDGLGRDGAPYALDIDITGQTESSYAAITHRIEDLHTLQGQTATLSFRANAQTLGRKIGIGLTQYNGSTGTDTNVGVVTLRTSMASPAERYSITFRVPGVEDQFFGTRNFLEVKFFLSVGSAWTALPSVGVQNDSFFLTDVQLEAGPFPTPFERLPRQTQLAWCQRYFYRLGGSSHPWLVPAMALGGNSIMAVAYYPATMRNKPLLTRRPGSLSNTGGIGNNQASFNTSNGFYFGTFSGTWMDENWNNEQVARIGWVDSASVAAGTVGQMLHGAFASWDFSAEI